MALNNFEGLERIKNHAKANSILAIENAKDEKELKEAIAEAVIGFGNGWIVSQAINIYYERQKIRG